MSPGPDQQPAPLTVYDVIDQFGLDYYEGRAVEFLLTHRQNIQAYAEDLRAAQDFLEQKVRRLASRTPPLANPPPGS